MGTVERLLSSVELPEMVSVRQKFDDTHIPVEEIPDVVKTQLDRTEIKEKIRPGMEIAITVGSRGVANIPVIIKAIGDFVKSRGATPLLVRAR